MAEMTRAQKDSAIKRINERYIQICREFGADSGVAKDYYHTMELVAGSENMRIIASTTSKKGPKDNPRYETGEIKVHQIVRNKKALDSMDPEEIQGLLNKHTAGQIKKAAKEEAKRQREESGDDSIDYNDVLEDMDYVYDYLDEYGYDSKDNEMLQSVLNMYWESAGPLAPRPLYSELRMLLEGKKRMMDLEDIGDTEYAKNIEDKLRKRIEADKGRDINDRVF